MIMKTLIIVDLQKDFISPSGTLYVKGGEELPGIIGEWIKENQENLRKVIFTVDWHKIGDKSFEINGGTWPIHCLQYSEGASLPDSLFLLCKELGINTEVIYKGNVEDHEEYGAFERNTGRTPWETLKLTGYMSGVVEVKPSDEFIVCGVAGDYCVKEAIGNLKKYLKNVVALEKAIRYIG